MVTKRAYPDTPVAMHYRPFEEIDWCELVGADEVVLVLTQVLLREMDQHKDHKRGVLQKRARRWNSWLGDLRRSKRWTVRPNVRVEVSVREPELDLDLAAHGLEASVNDDKVVACMLRDAKRAPEALLVCVTSDNALSFKVEAAGFEATAPLEAMRLADEPDPSEQEKRQLQKELTELRKRVDPKPDLGLHFEGGGDSFLVALRGLQAPTSDDLDDEVSVKRATFELQAKFVPSVLLRPPSAKAIERYLEEYRAWMVGATKSALRRARTFDVHLELVNRGLGNATDIEIDLTLPDGVFAARSRRIPKIDDPPMEPQPEDPYAFARLRSLEVPKFTYPRIDMAAFRGRDPERIEAGGSPHQIRISVDLARHQSKMSLPCFQAWFDGDQRPESFDVAYRIHAASTPNIRTGTLRIAMDVKEGPLSFLRYGRGRPEAEDDDSSVDDE